MRIAQNDDLGQKKSMSGAAPWIPRTAGLARICKAPHRDIGFRMGCHAWRLPSGMECVLHNVHEWTSSTSEGAEALGFDGV